MTTHAFCAGFMFGAGGAFMISGAFGLGVALLVFAFALWGLA